VDGPGAVRNSLPILIFHSLDEQGSVISFAPQAFQHNMARLWESGYRTVSLLDAAERVRLGQPFPSRSFVLTFDDGYQTVYDVAFPVLQRYDMSASVFITTGERKPGGLAERVPSCEGKTMLSWSQICELQRWGIEIGAHTCTHPDLTCLSNEENRAEIATSKAILENMLGAPVYSFAYPYGRYDRRSRDLVQQHFACACSDVLALVTPRSDPHALERIDAYYLRPDGFFDVMLTQWLPWYVLARRITRGIKRRLLTRTG
jgi:peptidoglycan/xylan/chitin deacetylase (PgdA/CDA1 family)